MPMGCPSHWSWRSQYPGEEGPCHLSRKTTNLDSIAMSYERDCPETTPRSEWQQQTEDKSSVNEKIEIVGLFVYDNDTMTKAAAVTEDG
jgi:hypothetical protein